MFKLIGALMLATAIGAVAVFLQYPGRFAAGIGTYFGLAALYGFLYDSVSRRDNAGSTRNEGRWFLACWLAALATAGITLVFIRPAHVNWAYWAGASATAVAGVLLGFGAYYLGQVMDMIDGERYA